MNRYTEDVNFDRKYQRLASMVYDTPKGLIRQTLLKEDIREFMPQLFEDRRLKVLDAGAGTGEISRWLASYGHQITRIDISGKMLEEAARRDSLSKITKPVTNCCQSIQDHGAEHPGHYDIIICHGMLAWMAEPQRGVQALAELIKPGGSISLLFYNRDRNILRNGLLANFYCLKSGDYHPRQKGGGLTPINPLRISELQEWLETHKLEIRFKSGIRIFYGLAKNSEEFHGKEEALLYTERLYYRREPFSSIGVHTHLVLHRPI